MVGVSDDRAGWIAQHVLPNEPWLRTRLARWRLPHGLEADDVIQEVYAKFAAMESVAEVRHPRNYLFSVVRTIVLMHIRHARVVSVCALDDFDASGFAADDPSPEEQASDREQLHLLALAVAELPKPSREAFMLRTISGLGHREIGRRLGMSENAVQKNLAKSLAMLMARLGRGGNGGDGASRGRITEVPTSDDAAREQRGD